MLTIIIPTKNRSDFLIRQLIYLYETGYKHCIDIGDSSTGYHLEQTKLFIRRVGSKLKINHFEYPVLNSFETLKQLVNNLSTPYAAFAGDDDFLVPSSLDKCIEFLEGHQGYSAVHGEGAAITLNLRGPFGQIVRENYYRQPIVEHEKASERLKHHLHNYSVSLFSVHRTQTWYAMYRDVNSHSYDGFVEELLPCSTSVVIGKIKQLDCFYLMRQNHNQRFALPTLDKWILSSNFYKSYDAFSKSLAYNVVQQDSISMIEALDIVNEAFTYYLTNRNIHNVIDTFTDNQRQDLFRLFPKLHSAKKIQSLNNANHDLKYMQQKSLISNDSKYFEDVKPVVKVIKDFR